MSKAKRGQFSSLSTADLISWHSEIVREIHNRATYHAEAKRIEQASSAEKRLGDIAVVATRLSKADFWVQRNGSVRTVGKPTKRPMVDYIGVRLLPGYDHEAVFAQLYHKWAMGGFRMLGRGSLITHIRVKDVASTLVKV